MKITKFLVLALILVLSSNCSEDFFDQVVEVEVPEHTPSLAVTCFIADSDSVLRVFVSNTLGILDNSSFSEIPDATVELYKDGDLLYTLPYRDENFYELQDITPLGISNATYTLRVSAPGYDPVEATQQMPQPVPIQNVTFEADGALTIDGDRADAIDIEWNDPANIENYYAVTGNVSLRVDTFEFPDNNIFLESSDPLAESVDDRSGVIVRDATFDGRNTEFAIYTYNMPDYELYEEVILEITLRSISRDRYLFEKSVSAYRDSRDNPFAEPVIVHSNFTNGAGIFALDASSTYELRIR